MYESTYILEYSSVQCLHMVMAPGRNKALLFITDHVTTIIIIRKHEKIYNHLCKSDIAKTRLAGPPEPPLLSHKYLIKQTLLVIDWPYIISLRAKYLVIY